jgi:catechol 2,3-dioxygenase-like lactoylglutathione lyase family enzyme
MITGLGHVGIFVRDLEKMVAFYRDFLGLRVTKQNWRAGTVFLSADPQAADHQIALVRGRPEGEEPKLIQQISFRCAVLDDVRQFHRRLVAAGFRIQRVVNHASAIGCYFYDPEGNCAEVFWVTGRESWVPVSIPIDLEQSDAAILAEVDRLHQRVRDVGLGERMPQEPPTLQF